MGLDYRQAGVDIDTGENLVPVYRDIAQKTAVPGVMGSLGGFGSLFSLKEYNLEDPVLVSGTDGVGTKLLLAGMLDDHSTVGIDLVAMCVNDIITCGARPLFFLDYFASGKLSEEQTAAVVRGIGRGCELAGCALTGGETAELPGMYKPGEYDLAGFAVGAVDRKRIIDGTAIRAGDIVIGLDASGLHSNGFSLVRKILETAELDLTQTYGLAGPLGEALLKPTCIYSRLVTGLGEAVSLHGIAHITGGGLPGNAGRILPETLALEIDTTAWTVPPLFRLLQEKGNVAEDEMFRVFNMGIGMIVILSPDDRDRAMAICADNAVGARQIGRVVEGNREVTFV